MECVSWLKFSKMKCEKYSDILNVDKRKTDFITKPVYLFHLLCSFTGAKLS